MGFDLLKWRRDVLCLLYSVVLWPLDIVEAHNASATGRCALWNVARLLFSSGFYTHDILFLSRELEMYRFICLKFINIEKQFKTFSLDGPWAILDEYYYKTYCSCPYDTFIFIISNFISVGSILWIVSGKLLKLFLFNKFVFCLHWKWKRVFKHINLLEVDYTNHNWGLLTNRHCKHV